MLDQAVNFVTLTKELLIDADETAFIFEVKAEASEIECINNVQSTDIFENNRVQILFNSVQKSIFRNNLMMVDGLMPNILAEVLLSALSNNSFSLPNIIESLDNSNPLVFPQLPQISYYRYKIREFLRHLALGMNATSVWMGEPNVYEHYPVLKDGEQIVYYTDSVDGFLELILKRAYVLKPNMEVYKKNGKPYMKLDLGIGLTA